ncbi:hypothetical protein [Azospirillum sp.]|uniref:hypothetical protein n=1 Tax=Azospirillum sp. TaxID=34012 RepID=UPI003D765AC1
MAWDTTPVPEPTSAVALVQELGRRAVSVLKYCTPDPGGDISVPTGRYAESLAPTNHLYVRFNFDYADAAAAHIREVGVFIGTIVDSGLPPGQTYFEPADLTSPGTLLALQRIPKIVRSAATRQSFEFVLTL